MMRTIVLLAGLALVTAVWASALRTVVVPRGASSRTMRLSVRATMSAGYWIGRRLPRGAQEKFLGVCAPLSVAPAVVLWMAGLTAGFVLVGSGAAGVAPTWAGAVGFLALRTGVDATALALAYWLSLALLVGCCLLYLSRLLAAYARREAILPLLANTSVPSDSDQLLADYARRGSADELNARLAQWASWLTDVGASHLAYPALTHFRPAGDLTWLNASVVMLDVAALAEAIAPGWAPPNTRVLLCVGTKTLPALAEQLNIAPHRPVVSLHGREGRPFDLTVQVMVKSLRRRERDVAQMWRIFQHWRAQYAPYAYAMSTRLLFEPTTDVPPADVIELAQHQGVHQQEGISDDDLA